ncbi:phosphatidylserine decarboxylase [Sulfuriflexus mobilis]|uniref:phosphatidylserine decarboxylase n=1 Tax=Sulfuriflexus mobilis TaxID=1811807 RepID=UPI000F841E3A|nr:phosphatidylserine decarboxylase [Sulfuriflexus mobilis]
MKRHAILRMVTAATAVCLCFSVFTAQAALLTTAQKKEVAKSPCAVSINYLIKQYQSEPDVAASFDLMAGNLVDPPESYHMLNPWRVTGGGEALLGKMVDYFTEWCTFLPRINGSEDNGLAYIQGFGWLYYQNTPAQNFVQGRNPLDPSKALETGLKFTSDFSKQRGAFMDGPDSTTYIQQWIDDPRIEIVDYQRKRASDYKSWNDFFARELMIDTKTRTIPSRPVTMPDRDYVISAPTDCIMNPLVQVLTEDGKVVRREYLQNPLQYNTVLDVKGIPLSMAELLKGVAPELQSRFVGGNGLACILMPNTYHRFHTPVTGIIRHADVVVSGTYGYPDWPNWVSQSGNVAGPGTDFSQFQLFQRGVIIIEVNYADVKEGNVKTGYVASIPVGLDTIGSVVLRKNIRPGEKVTRGYTELGNFYYGGSLNILLFSPGMVSPAVQTRLGNQIGVINVGTTPPVKN